MNPISPALDELRCFSRKGQIFDHPSTACRLPVHRRVVIEEAVAGVVVPVELVLLAVLFQRRFVDDPPVPAVGERSSSPKRPRIGQERSFV